MNTFDLTRLPDWAPAVIVVVALWTLFWKGLALWHAARNDSRPWFIILLVINTLGILEIIYLFFVAKIKSNK
ncbi:MAG: DUF5652 family protein [Candidatus Saccharibacteria bacterium]